MPRPRNTIPPLKYHSATGQHCVYIANRRINLGADPAEAHRRYQQLCKDLLDGKPAPAPTRQSGRSAGVPLSVSEALLRYMRDHAVEFYRDQPPTLRRLWEMVAAVQKLHGGIPADQFRGRQLKEVRQYLLAERGCKRTGRPLSRTYVNHLVRAAQRCWKWLLSEGDVSADCVASVAEVEAIHRGKGGREPARVLPPGPGWSAALLALPPTLYAMVRVQQLGAMRPQDVCRMRRRDLSTDPAERVMFPGTSAFASAVRIGSTLIWTYIPSDHKTAHLGKPRAVALGLDAQRLLEPLIRDLKPDDYVFSPARALAEARRGNRYKREGYSKCYAVRQYAQCIERAIERVNRRRIEAGVPVEDHVPHWTPNQLRHLQATVVEERLDREHARAMLGHSSQDVIARYAEQAFIKAARAAAECG